jgi:hypothetical protein
MITSENGVLGPQTLGSNYYEYDHYSGSQIVVMFGDILIDNAVAVQFDVQQSKTPVYGYANQYYSFVAAGHVLVQGTLTIAFKETGYLLWPIQRYINQTGPSKSTTQSGKSDWFTSPRFSVGDNGQLNRGYEQKDYSLLEASKAARRKEVMQANVEQMKEWQSQGSSSRQNAQYNKFWTDLGALPDDSFEDWAEVFEDAIWYGADPSNPLVRDKLFSKNFTEDTIAISEEEVLQHRRPDQYPAIDILVVYGDMSEQAPNHTVKKLLDVSFVGSSQTIEISGQPTYEQYSFIARNLV